MNHKFQTILLKAKEDVYTHLSGGMLSKKLGQGYDFAELREYERSDDIRHISWINSAKLGEPYVKKMHEERALKVALCTIMDGRFMVGEKKNTLLQTVATIAYSAYHANDSLYFMHAKEKGLQTIEASKNMETIEDGMQQLYELNPLGTSISYDSVVSQLLKQIEQKSLLFIVGDFLEHVDLSILAQKHEVLVLIVRDHEEENPSVLGGKQLMNPQTKQMINQSLSKKAIAHYLQRRLEHDTALFEHCYQNNIRFVKIYELEEVMEKLERLFL